MLIDELRKDFPALKDASDYEVLKATYNDFGAPYNESFDQYAHRMGLKSFKQPTTSEAFQNGLLNSATFNLAPTVVAGMEAPIDYVVQKAKNLLGTDSTELGLSDAFDQARRGLNATMEAGRDLHGVANFGGEVGGLLLNAPTKVGNAVQMGADAIASRLGANAAPRWVAPLATNTVQGAALGVGDALNQGKPENALEGAETGALFGALAQPAGAAIAKGVGATGKVMSSVGDALDKGTQMLAKMPSAVTQSAGKLPFLSSVTNLAGQADTKMYDMLKMLGLSETKTLQKLVAEVENPANRDLVLHSLEDAVMNDEGYGLVMRFSRDMPKQYRQMIEAPDLARNEAGYETQRFLKSIFDGKRINYDEVERWMRRDPFTFTSNILHLSDGATKKAFTRDVTDLITSRSAKDRVDYHVMRDDLRQNMNSEERAAANRYMELEGESGQTYADPDSSTPQKIYNNWMREFGDIKSTPVIPNSTDVIAPSYGALGTAGKWAWDIIGNRTAGLVAEPLVMAATGLPGGFALANAGVNLSGKTLKGVGNALENAGSDHAITEGVAGIADKFGRFANRFKSGANDLSFSSPRSYSYSRANPENLITTATRASTDIGDAIRDMGPNAIQAFRTTAMKQGLLPMTSDDRLDNRDGTFAAYRAQLAGLNTKPEQSHAETIKVGVNELLNNPQGALLKLQAIRPDIAVQLQRAMQQGEGVYKAVLFNLTQNPETRAILGAQ